MMGGLTSLTYRAGADAFYQALNGRHTFQRLCKQRKYMTVFENDVRVHLFMAMHTNTAFTLHKITRPARHGSA